MQFSPSLVRTDAGLPKHRDCHKQNGLFSVFIFIFAALCRAIFRVLACFGPRTPPTTLCHTDNKILPRVCSRPNTLSTSFDCIYFPAVIFSGRPQTSTHSRTQLQLILALDESLPSEHAILFRALVAFRTRKEREELGKLTPFRSFLTINRYLIINKFAAEPLPRPTARTLCTFGVVLSHALRRTTQTQRNRARWYWRVFFVFPFSTATTTHWCSL